MQNTILALHYSPNLLQLIPLATQHITAFFNLSSSLALRRANILKDSSSRHTALNANTFLSPLHHLPLNSLLNSENELDISLSDQRDSLTSPASTGGTTNTVDVIVWVPRHVEIDNKADDGNIETTGCNVRGNENPGSRSSESGEV
jgi:hypothetical protein